MEAKIEALLEEAEKNQKDAQRLKEEEAAAAGAEQSQEDG